MRELEMNIGHIEHSSKYSRSKYSRELEIKGRIYRMSLIGKLGYRNYLGYSAG